MAWLLTQQRDDGGWKALDDAPVDAFYKAGWAFNLLGEAAAAERVLDYVKAHFLQPNGDFLPRGNPWHVDVHYQYANGWFVIGAQKHGRYDVARPGLEFLLTQQDPDHGGFYSHRSTGQKQRSDTMSTGISGIACLAAGQMGRAKQVANCLERMIDMQPAPKERFYTTIESNGELGTDFPDEEAFWRVVDTGEADQCWYAVGLPFTFAFLMHAATEDARYADLMRWFLEFQERCVNPWDGGSSGKAAWGCSMLYRTTGEERYRDIALRVARSYMNRQGTDGYFIRGGQDAYGQEKDGGEKPSFVPGDFDGNAELVVWLALIGSNLLARDA
jgi:hypothetical protein